jgi:RecB family endonuclease NucS
MEAIQASDMLLKATINMDCDAVAAGLDAVHMANTSILNYNDENALACVITLAYYNAMNEYTIHREQPAGKGYADMVFLPRKYSNYPAMVVELKMNQSAESALAQIKERRYVEALRSYTDNNASAKILLVGVNYDKETKEHTCVIEELER